jgi:hypothetical protein
MITVHKDAEGREHAWQFAENSAIRQSDHIIPTRGIQVYQITALQLLCGTYHTTVEKIQLIRKRSLALPCCEDIRHP